MDRNQVIGWVLIGLIIVGFVFYQTSQAPLPQPQNTKENVGNTASSKEKNTKTHVEKDSLKLFDNQKLPDSLRNVFEAEKLKEQHGIFYTAAQGKNEYVIIENDLVKLWIAKKGAYLAQAQLKNFRTYDAYTKNIQENLNVFVKDSSKYFLSFNHDGKSFSTADYFFQSSVDSIYITEENQSVSFILQASNGGKMEYTYTLHPKDYLVDFNISMVDLNRYITGDGNKINMEWEQIAPQQEKSLKQERQIASIFYFSDKEGRDYLSETSNDQSTFEGNVKWISFKQQFFSTVLISKTSEIQKPQMTVAFNQEDTTYVKKFNTKFGLELLGNNTSSANLTFFVGPNDFNLLSNYEDLHLNEQLNLGWGIFRWVNEYFIYPIFSLLVNNLGVSIGLGIILLTFAIKLVLFPITYKNYLSSAKMRVIKPHLEKLNEENKNADPLKKQQAMMALYKQTGVNPLAGCIPALLQMPILIALYRLFPASIELRHQPFLWAEDLSSFDSVLDLPFNIWGYGNHVSLFTLLMAISMFFYMRFNQQMTPSTGSTGGGELQEAIQKNMKIMMNIMPFFMLFIFNGFAAGLSFYYFLANMITIAQTLVIKHYIIDEERILSKINEHMAKPMQKSKWQKKIEEIQAKQKK